MSIRNDFADFRAAVHDREDPRHRRLDEAIGRAIRIPVTYAAMAGLFAFAFTFVFPVIPLVIFMARGGL